MSSAHWRQGRRHRSPALSHRDSACGSPAPPNHRRDEALPSIRQKRQRSRRGFTLIELLVALAIAAVLLALLIPRVKSGLESARSAKCAGNLKQLGAQTMAYVAENGFYPLMINQTNSVPTPEPVNFYEYIRNSPAKACAICPSAKFTGYSKNGRPQEGYGGNPMILRVSLDGTPPPVRPGQVMRPSEVILLTDGAQTKDNGFALGLSTIWFGKFNATAKGSSSQAETPLTDLEVLPGGFWDPEVSQIPLRHNGRANILFCDGHVLSISAIGDLKQKNIYWNY